MKLHTKKGKINTFVVAKAFCLFTVIALSNINTSFAQEFPKSFPWLTDTVYISPSAPDGGNGSYASPYNEIDDFEFTSKRAYLFKRDDSLLFYGATISSDSLFIGTYGSGAKPKFLGQNIGHHFTFSGTEQYVQGLSVVCNDTGTCFRFRASEEGKFLWADSLEAKAAFKGMEPSGYGKIIISNSLITRIRCDGLYSSHNDTIILRNTKINDVNRWYEKILDIGTSGGDCFQGESNGYVEVTDCYLDHSDVAGKFAMIQNAADSVYVKNTTFKSWSESAAVYGGPPKGWRFEECKFIGGVYGIRNFSLLIIENCIFEDQTKSSISGEGAEIYNSNFVNVSGTRVLNGWGSAGWKVNNSIFYNVNHIYGAMEQYVTASNNIYYNPTGDQPINQWGDNVYNIDPKFVGVDVYDFHLEETSPAIDSGLIFGHITNDFEGSRRYTGTSFDIGAYEFYSEEDLANAANEGSEDGSNQSEEVTNNAPVIVSTYDSTAKSGFVATIDVSESYDEDEDGLTFQWTAPENIHLSSETSSVVNFLTPSPLTANTTYTVSVVVSDGTDTSTQNFDIVGKPYKPEAGKIDMSSIESSDYQDPNYPENISDNDLSTRWSSEGDEEWITIELASPASISYLSLSYYHGDYRKGYFNIMASTDNETWSEILSGQETCGISTKNQNFEVPSTKSTDQYKYIRLVGEGNSENNWNSICEMSVYGTTSSFSGLGNSSFADTPVQVYPNPASSHVTIETTAEGKIPQAFQILSIDGKALMRETFDGELQKELDLGLKSGIYNILVNYSDGTAYTKTLIVN
jgi:hypothetical protein